MSCPFCHYDGSVVADYGLHLVITPLRPVADGHVIVIPKLHAMDAVRYPGLFGEAAKVAAQYAREARLGACNIITSVGAAATQTVFHLHVHVVPRVDGDGLLLPWSG